MSVGVGVRGVEEHTEQYSGVAEAAGVGSEQERIPCRVSLDHFAGDGSLLIIRGEIYTREI